VLFFALSGCGLFADPPDNCTKIERIIDEYMEERPDKIKKYAWALSQDETNKFTLLASFNTNSFVLEPGTHFTIVGPIGTVVMVVLSDGERDYKMPEHTTVKAIEDGTLKVLRYHKKALFYAGYYHPDKESGEPQAVPKNSRVIVYTFDNSFFKETSKLKDLSNDPVKSVSDNLYIKRVYSSSFWLTFTCWFSVALTVSCMVFFNKFMAWTERKLSKPGSALPFESMRYLFNSGKKKFLCLHCGENLKIKGKFQCRFGHVPDKDKYIFKKCGVRTSAGKCPEEFNYMKCNHCGCEIALNETNYNEEEIQNRGKKYILRPHRLKKTVEFFLLVGLLMASSTPMMIYKDVIGKDIHYPSSIYIDLYGNFNFFNNIDPSIYYLIFNILLLVGFFVYSKYFTEGVRIKNPYET